jgi:pimeloyl-ACP methyl ester carboxylesterase
MSAGLAIRSEGSGPPLVLLHGIAADSSIWSAVTPTLARHWRVLAVDLPGFGGSEPVGEGFVLDEVADAILAGIREAGVEEPFALVGHSLGGAVAITLAARRPEAVGRLVLVAPAGVRPLPAPISSLLLSEELGRVISTGADAFLAARRGAAGLAELGWGRRLLLGLAVADGARIPPKVARLMLEASLHARRTGPALAAIAGADLAAVLARTAMPLSAIWGAADLTVPIRALEDVLAARPDARVEQMPDAGHVPMVEAPARFTDALLRLLGDDTTPSGGPPTLSR